MKSPRNTLMKVGRSPITSGIGLAMEPAIVCATSTIWVMLSEKVYGALDERCPTP